MHKIILIIFFQFFCSDVSHCQFLKNFDILPLNDMTDKNLYFLKDILKDKKIVFLGEQTHLNATDSRAKEKLIKYLHEELGFNVLILENNFGSFKYGYDEIVKKPDSAVFIMAKLTQSAYWCLDSLYFDVAKLVEKSLKTANPLILEGLDIVPSSSYDLLVLSKIESSFNKIFKGFNKTQGYKYFVEFALKGQIKKSGLDSTLKGKSPAYFSSKLSELLNWADSTIRIIQPSLEPSEITEYNFCVQALKSIHFYYLHILIDKKNILPNGMVTFDTYKIRDSGMGNNLNWLLNKYLENNKIIISTSSYHITKNIDSLITMPDGLTKGTKPMINFLSDYNKKLSYNIAFLCGVGEIGYETIVQQVLKPPRKSLEKILMKKNIEKIFLQFKEGKSTKFKMMPTFYDYYVEDWSKHYDAILFSRTAKPGNRVYLNMNINDLNGFDYPDDWYSK
jgi:erythromycin esterase